MSKFEMKMLALLVVIVGMVAVFWHFRDDILPTEDIPVVTESESDAEQVPTQSTPLHPVAPVASTEASEPEPLPPLDHGDSSFVSAVIDTLGDAVEGFLVKDALVDRFVATIDNLPRKHVSEKIRPVGKLATQFNAAATDDDASFVLGPENYQRYDLLVDLLSNADVDAMAAMYRRYYPLFQESYERLGYPNGYFNDRVVEVIDHLLATQEPRERIKLVRPHVLYQFADPDLEALSSGQKLLLRMGNEHTLRVKGVLLALRSSLAAPLP